MNPSLITALSIQRQAWNSGHDNYGASIDVHAEAVTVLKSFKHLNPAQKSFADALAQIDELKFAKPLCSAARKAVRHVVVALK